LTGLRPDGRTDRKRDHHFFAYDATGLDPQNVEPDKCARLDWFALDALPEKTVPYAAWALGAIERGELFACSGW
jgi:hypothetical protein